MTEDIPDFEATVPPVVDYPKPKKPRRKPTRRKAKKTAKSLYTKVTEAPKKRKTMKRRGRPAGVPNKPKVEQHHGGRFSKEQYRMIGALLEMAPQDRAALLDIVEGLAK